MARSSAASRPLTDHQEIRSWAEERGAKPACVRGTGGSNDVGIIRLDFPGYSGEGSLDEISWDEWFQQFDDSDLALLVQNQTADGQQSNFNKLVSKETAGLDRGNRKNSSTHISARSFGRRAQATSTSNGVAEDEDESSEDDTDFEEEGEASVSGDMAEADYEEADLDDLKQSGQRNGRGKTNRSRSRQTQAGSQTRSSSRSSKSTTGRRTSIRSRSKNQSRSTNRGTPAGNRRSRSRSAQGRSS